MKKGYIAWHSLGSGETFESKKLQQKCSFLSQLILFLSCLFLSNCNTTKKIKDKELYNCISSKAISDPCFVLGILSDSIKFSENFTDKIQSIAIKKEKCLYETINILFSKANLEPHLICTFDLCHYNSFDLHKSVYKIDILRLMRYYHCSDSIRLQNFTKGEFELMDMKQIKRASERGMSNIIDTMILYGK